jgi:hypothetical protein
MKDAYLKNFFSLIPCFMFFNQVKERWAKGREKKAGVPGEVFYFVSHLLFSPFPSPIFIVPG